ncbi:hypothetical protein MRX96_039589 [Rhipicephalus microplus]
MRTSLVLCATFLLLLWRLWNYLVPLQHLARILGSTWIALTLSYYLSRFVWTRLFVAEISGDGKAVLITVLPLDVTKQNQVDDALVSVKENIGNRVLWSVVANAGIGSRGLLGVADDGNCDQHFRRQRFRGTTGHQKFLPLLRKKPRKGRHHCEPFRPLHKPNDLVWTLSPWSLRLTVRRSSKRAAVLWTPVMREFRQQEPDAIATYTHQDVEDWMKALDKGFEAVMREDPEEGVTVMERAVRETFPDTVYRSPWGRDTCPCIL